MDIINDANKIGWKVKAKHYRKEHLKQKVREKVHATCEWVSSNMELIVTFTPVVIYAGRSIVGITKSIHRGAMLRKEQDLKDLYCYDRSLGHYWSLKRKLTNREWVAIDQRKRNGEKLGDILAELKVLK